MEKHKAHLSFLLLLAFFYLSACAPQLHKSSSVAFIPSDASVEVDSSIDSFVRPYREDLQEAMGRVIGETSGEINKSGKGETAIGNLISDLQKEHAEITFGYPIDISAMNNGGIRNTLPAGKITLGNIYELSPFDNYLYVLELDAAKVRQLAEYAVNKKSLGLSGMEITSKEGQLVSYLVNGKMVVEGQTYLLAVNDYMASGGDNLDFLIEAPRKEQTTIVLRDVLIERIKAISAKGEKISAKVEGRQKLD
ncbi:5'-nucleotidase [Indibacter alkaliphilus LW1]|uniref:5'-nucleotidase n=1 Tax=Indibacter alkaliphilus (strain CCUG 57479 / KCTC 22604 / LW1) TaxID=1189612 RepID=S2DMS9_INDAL|nr:5'-nucleotidase C-terminal domain-containing protein [Indibacter alkaliphilus]EOZ93241.1 5'-nucleotidase [Indibacter alkaliphilus LW1]